MHLYPKIATIHCNRFFTPKLQCNFAKWEPGHGNFYFRYPWGLK